MVPALPRTGADDAPPSKKRREDPEVSQIAKRVSAVARPGKRRSSIEPQLDETLLEPQAPACALAADQERPLQRETFLEATPQAGSSEHAHPRRAVPAEGSGSARSAGPFDGAWMRDHGCRTLVIYGGRLYWPDGNVSEMVVRLRSCELTYEGVSYHGKLVDDGTRLHWDDAEVWHKVPGDAKELSELLTNLELTPAAYTPNSAHSDWECDSVATRCCDTHTEIQTSAMTQAMSHAHANASAVTVGSAAASQHLQANISRDPEGVRCRALSCWAELLKWLGLLAQKHSIRSETHILTADVLARFLSSGAVDMDTALARLPFSEQYIMGAAALRIAAKFEEARDLKELDRDVENRGICPWLIDDAEAGILMTLRFRLHRETSWHKLRRNSDLESDEMQWNLAQYLLELGLRCFTVAEQPSGAYATATLLAMRRLLRQPEHGTVAKDIDDMALSLLSLASCISETDAVAVRHAESAQLARLLSIGLHSHQ